MGARVTATFEELLLMKAEARGFSLSPRQPIASLLSGRHASRLRGRGLDFEELRQYQQGDDVRNMDWKATARLRSPQVRVYTEERERPVLLLVDQRSPMFFGSRRVMKSVAAAEAAALSAWRASHYGDRVGGMVFNEAEVVEVRPQRGQASVLRLLHEVARLNQALDASPGVSGEVALNRVLERALRLARHGCLVVVISDLDGADDETERLATLLAAHNDVLIVPVYDPLGASLSGGPSMLATDRKQTWRIPDSSDFSAKFREAFSSRIALWREVFRSLRIPMMPLSTARPVGEQVRAHLGRARRLS